MFALAGLARGLAFCKPALGKVSAVTLPGLGSFSALPNRSLDSPQPSVLSRLPSIFNVFARGVSVYRAQGMIRFKPTSPGIRHRVAVDKSHLWNRGPWKPLTEGKHKTGGRNHHGRITAWHRGGGNKRRYRIIDFKRSIEDIPGVVERLEYDPNRSAWIALIKYPEEKYQYIIAPKDLNPGDEVLCSRTNEISLRVGNAMPIGKMPIGTIFHCLEMKPRRGAQLARSAGSSCQLLEKNYRENYALVRNVSKELRLVHQECLATIGEVSNTQHKLEKWGKAGRARWFGWRPHVRGTVMNPVDHPHGGNSNKGGRVSCTPWGIPTKGKKTRNPRKINKLILIRAGGVEKTAEMLKERQKQQKSASAASAASATKKSDDKAAKGKKGAKGQPKTQKKKAKA